MKTLVEKIDFLNDLKLKPMVKARGKKAGVTIRVRRNETTVGYSIFNNQIRVHTDAGFANPNEAQRDAITYCERKEFKVDKIVIS